MDGGTVAGIAAEERGVGAMQSRDYAGLEMGRQHAAREDGGGGVGDCVVDVQYVEGVFAADFGHFDREGQGVVGVFKEAVVVDLDLVKERAGRAVGVAKGFFVGDKVHLVAALGELPAEGRGDDARASD